MTRARTLVVASILVLAAMTAVLLAWRPWDPVPDELRAAVTRIDQLPGVLDAEVDYEVVRRDLKDGDSARAFVTAQLDEDLRPEQAGEAAGRAEALLDDVTVPGVASFDRSLQVVAGERVSTNGVDLYPVMVTVPGSGDGPESGAIGVEQAFALRHAGALGVRGTTTVRDGEHLVELAQFAADHGIATSLRTTDDRLAYEAMGTVPDVDAARLVTAIGALAGVRSVGYDAYAEPSLRVGLDVATDSAVADDVVARIEAIDDADRLGHPVAVSLTDPQFIIRSAWVSDLVPPEPEPHTLPLPADVESWPDDGTAPDCTDTDLELSYGGSDAAAGTRFASVRARNVGDVACAVEGVPELVFRNAGGEPQHDVTLEPYEPGVVAARVVVPPGAEIFAPLRWGAMSTANDPDAATAIEVRALPGAEPALLDVTGHVSSPSGLDVLDGAQVRVGPWVQAADGWS